ncbi:MAG: glycosyltransferase, partial [Bacteroidetes bacterium]|nr:glycosyltransferase [Bacteroidota bacterium]
ILKEKQPNLPVEIVVMGKSEIEPLMLLPYPVHLLGMIQKPEDLAMVYGACDVFVIPSLEDNLPNTVMESLACGLPVAGFDTGGIPEMVRAGLEGEIVPQKDAEALANGIAQILGKESYRTAARLKAEQCYAEPIVAQQYIHLYKSLIELA